MSNASTTLGKDKDVMTTPERGGEMGGNVVVLLPIAFFVYHQVVNTGFFTSGFGPLETFLFYLAGIAGFMAPTARALTGRRSRARWFELGSALLWAATSIWLLFVFPFNFAHLADPLPTYLRFILSWVSNDIGRIILVLTALASIGTAIYNIVKIVLGRRRGKSFESSMINRLR